jgi:hypothetical protein
MVPRKALFGDELHRLVTRRVSEVFATDLLADTSGYQFHAKSWEAAGRGFIRRAKDCW